MSFYNDMREVVKKFSLNLQPCFTLLFFLFVFSWQIVWLETLCAIARSFSVVLTTFSLCLSLNISGLDSTNYSFKLIHDLYTHLLTVTLFFSSLSLQSWSSSILLLPRNSAGCGDVLEAGPQGDYRICPSVASKEGSTHNRYSWKCMQSHLQVAEQWCFFLFWFPTVALGIFNETRRVSLVKRSKTFKSIQTTLQQIYMHLQHKQSVCDFFSISIL